MKLSYTSEEVEAWRDRTHWRTSGFAVRTKAQALRFIERVGFCFAFKAEQSEAPCLWHAAMGQRSPEMPPHYHRDRYLSSAWKMKDVLPAEERIYYGKLLRSRPTIVSLEYFPYFYVLAHRSGARDEYLTESARGRLSSSARRIMDALSETSPQTTKDLKLSAGFHSNGDRRLFDRAISELQRKMFIVKVAEHYDPFIFEWETVLKRFSRETRRSRRITEEQARQKILQKYFENQLVGTVTTIQRLFGWEKQAIFRALGHLKNCGVISPDVMVDKGKSKYYGLIHMNQRIS